MKTRISPVLTALIAVTLVACAQKGTLQNGEPVPIKTPPPPPPKVWEDPDYRNPWASPQAVPGNQTPPAYVYEQKLAGGAPALITREQAQTVIDRFRESYPKLGSPRFLIYVNRDLVDEKSGLKLTAREEKTETSRGGTNSEPAQRTTVENSYRADDKAESTLADRQTVRDVERLFGRPLRSAGATLTDQRVATQLINDRPLSEFVSASEAPQAKKDREALSRIADVVIEILISSKSMVVPTISDAQSISMPDIQATAIRLKDFQILGQASSMDVTGRVPPATLGNFGVNEVAEATALALMEDMSQ